MRFSAPILTVMGTVAGTAAAFVAYQATASVAQTQNESSTVAPTPSPAAPVFLPCEDGWKLRGDVCVRVKKKVVVVHDAPAPAPAPVTSSVVTGSGTQGGGSEDSTEVEHASTENESDDAAEGATEDSGHDSPDSSTEDSAQAGSGD